MKKINKKILNQAVRFAHPLRDRLTASPVAQNDRQEGRSMVEMLGVLAIIGILSVTGIIGYTVAMRKYRANEIAQAISMLAVSAKTANYGAGVDEDTNYTTLIEDANMPSGAETLRALAANGKFKKEIELVTDSEDLCLAVANIFGRSTTNPLYVKSESCETDQTLVIQTK